MGTFIISILTAIISAALVALIGKLATNEAKPSTEIQPEIYSAPRTIIVASSFAVAAWAIMLACCLAIALFVTGIYSDDKLIAVMLGTLICTCLLFIITVTLLKCSHCERRIFVQWKQEPPPYSIKFKGMCGWSSIVLQVLCRREFQCMHCGKKYKINSNA